MSYRDNPAADIFEDSLWEGAEAIAKVRGTGSGYVRVELVGASGVEHALYHEAFRRAFVRILELDFRVDPCEYDARQVRSQFSMSIANLGDFAAYWIPSSRRIIARSIGCSKKWPIPDEAILVGTYSHPFDSSEFLRDLDDVLATIREAPAADAAFA